LKQAYLLILLSLISLSLLAQDVPKIIGKVTDKNNVPIEPVNIIVRETNQYTTTDKLGLFSIKLNNLSNVKLTLEFTYIGYQTVKKVVEVKNGGNDLGTIILKELNLSLESIDINAKRNYAGSSNSSLIITRSIIEQTPALSLNDLLSQIPNRKMTAPSLQNVQNITLRSTYATTVNNRGTFELNNAFGVAIILDGNAISNNMNMQSYNPGINGAGSSLLSSQASYGLNGSPTTSYSGDYAFGGTDLRQIPADNIESVEIIAGVAPVRYGDLSDGAIVVERQAGRAPGYVRMQIRDNATSYAYSQGFKLSPTGGALNVGVNYVTSYADNRDKLKAYKRINTNAMYSNTYGKDKRFKNTLSFDYGRNLDGLKKDPDDIYATEVRFDSWNVSVANRSSYRLSTNFLKNVSLNLRYAEGHQVSYRQQGRNELYQLVSDATTTGIHEGGYAPGIYKATSLIDGRPVNASAKLDFNGDFTTGGTTHFIGWGLSYDYGLNKGAGQVLDPNQPRALTAVNGSSTTPNRSERYYDFKLAVAQQNFGLYLEDQFNVEVFDRALNFRGGLRYDLQNALPTFSPRINANYAISDLVKIGLAYGLSYKSPGLSQRYPGPTYFEIPLLNSYNGKALESKYLVYVNRFDPDNSHLKSSKSQTLELSTHISIRDFSLSATLFSKNSRNGITTSPQRTFVNLPTYSATPVQGQQPVVTETGSKIYSYTTSLFQNDLTSNNQGLEIILSSPKIKPLSTTFTFSGGIFRTYYFSKSLATKSFDDVSSTRPDFAIQGFYEPTERVSWLSNTRLSSVTHIPKISLIINLTAEFALLEKTVQSATAGVPIGYYTRDGRYLQILDKDFSNADYGHAFVADSELNEANVNKIIPNFHLSLAKEIKNRFRFAFNVYNVFNYQPYYISSTNTYNYPNAAPSFGAEISLKL
jgi:ferric enterobactin receptor